VGGFLSEATKALGSKSISVPSPQQEMENFKLKKIIFNKGLTIKQDKI